MTRNKSTVCKRYVTWHAILMRKLTTVSVCCFSTGLVSMVSAPGMDWPRPNTWKNKHRHKGIFHYFWMTSLSVEGNRNGFNRAGPLLGREFQRAVTRSWLCCKACREILSSKSDFLITTLSRFSTAVTSAQEVIHDRQALTDMTKKSLAGKILTQRRILGAALG